MTVKNPNYLRFKSEGIIEYVTENHIREAIKNIDKCTLKRRREEAKALLIVMYYTGCRPAEALLMKSKDCVKDGAYLKLTVKTLKRGRARVIWLSFRKFPLIKHLWEWHLKKYHEEFLFRSFQGQYKNHQEWDKKIILKDSSTGEEIEQKSRVKRDYILIAQKLPYYFKRWFDGVFTDGVNPYYLRHNKFSKLAESGASDRDLMIMKGSRSYNSIEYYIHRSEKRGKKLATLGG